LTSDFLHLKIYEKAPFICVLTHPMIIKIPVISIQYFVQLHVKFTFNSIRKSKHEHADLIIDYLYDLLFLQQKIASSLHEFLRLLDFAFREKKDAMMINAEINAIMYADFIVLLTP
ncbi:MAG: hypothetical protein GXO79_09770, partial [Chlorobi bacterium]|nr:hypothetical protein [Chlorobiota bacterium]